MGSRNRLWRILALLLSLSLVAAACGSDSEGATGAEGGDSDEDPETSDAMEDPEDEPETTDEPEDDPEEDPEEDPEGGEGTVEAAPECTGDSDGVLKFGGLLPETGNLAFLGPPEVAGVELAVADINEAGGVLDTDVEYEPGDSGDSADTAVPTVERHLENDVDVILGAASSGVSFTVIDTIVNACKIHFSPANTSPDFTTYDDDDLYFRTAPSDVLQGRVLAELIIDEGRESVAIMALQDPYGEGLLKFTSEPLEDAGVAIAESFTYDPQAQNFDPEVQMMVDAEADALVIIGFEESAQIITGLLESQIAADTIYLVDGNVGNALGENFTEEGILTGIKGTLPGAEVSQDFQDRLLETDPELVDFSYGPETYDATIITALAAQVAGTDDPAQVAAAMNGVTRDGEKCTTFADCKDLIDAGTDIDYDGPSGPQSFGPAGEPTEATFQILSYGGDVNADDDAGNVNEIDPSLTEYQSAALSG